MPTERAAVTGIRLGKRSLTSGIWILTGITIHRSSR